MRLARRVGRLEAPRDGRLPPWARAMCVRLAEEDVLDPDEVIREAEAILAQAAAAGVFGSPKTWAAFLAAEGADPEALLAEAERWLARR